MTTFFLLFNKFYLLFKKAKDFAIKIGYYNDENSIFVQEKLKILNEFINEYGLDKFVLDTNNKDIIVLENLKLKNYIFITNNDYLTLALPSTSNNSCMSIKGIYNLSLIFEKILFGNCFLNIFTIDDNYITKKEISDFMNKNNYNELLKTYYFTGIKDYYAGNKRVSLFYLPNKMTYMFENHPINNTNANQNLTRTFNEILPCKRYFITIGDFSIKNLNVYNLITNSTDIDTNYEFYTHKIKLGVIISEKNFNNFINFVNEKKLEYKIIDDSIIKIENINNTAPEIILLEYPNLKKHFYSKINLIKKIFNYIYTDAKICPICNYEYNKKGSIFCENVLSNLKFWNFGIDINEDDYYFIMLKNIKNLCSSFYKKENYIEEEDDNFDEEL